MLPFLYRCLCLGLLDIDETTSIFHINEILNCNNIKKNMKVKVMYEKKLFTVKVVDIGKFSLRSTNYKVL